MNRKSLIFASVLAVLLLGGIAYMFHALFMEDSRKGEAEYKSLSEGICAVPSDAISVLEAENLSDISRIMDSGSALGDFIGCIPDYSSEAEAVFSWHYSNKNTVSPLLVVTVPDEKAVSDIVPDILSKCRGVIDKRYDSYFIHKSSVPDISFTLYDRYLIASPSIVIVEAALRHISSGSSIVEIIPKGISVGSDKDAVLQVNFENLGKLFSGTVAQANLRYASFFQKIAEWGTFGIGTDGDGLTVMDGRLYPDESGESFCDVLLSQRGRVSDVYQAVPHNTSFVLTLPVNPVGTYLSAYSSYLSANGKKKDYDYILATLPSVDGKTPSSFAKEAEIGELALFTVNYGEEKKVLGIRAEKPSAIKASEDSVSDYPYGGYIASLFGKVFTPSAEECCFLAGKWTIVGGKEEITKLFDSYRSGAFFSFEDYISQTPASGEIGNLTAMSLIVNAEKYRNEMVSYFREPYSSKMKKSFGNRNFEFIALSARKIGKDLGFRAACYSEDLAALPMPKTAATSAAGLTDGTVVSIPEGPFEVVDFRDGSRNFLEQLPNNNIRLLNSSRRALWTIPFNAKICGTVRQIDYLKNDKLQMLFGAGSMIYLYDRLGRSVGKFPIETGKEILLGPDVYDFNGDKNYTMVVLHSDNTIAQYDINGEKVPAWTEIRLNEKIVSLPERVVAGNTACWVVRTSFQTIVYDAGGIPVADFSKKWRLKKDSPVEVLSDNEIGVVTADDKAAVINLKNRTVKRR